MLHFQNEVWMRHIFIKDKLMPFHNIAGVLAGSHYLQDRSVRREKKRFPLIVQKGEIVIMHYNLWHSGGRNLHGKSMHTALSLIMFS